MCCGIYDCHVMHMLKPESKAYSHTAHAFDGGVGATARAQAAAISKAVKAFRAHEAQRRKQLQVQRKLHQA